MELKPVFLREQKRYSQQELISKFNKDESKVVKTLKRLKEYGVLKAVKATEEQKNLSDLTEEYVEIADVEAGENEYLYVFTFVGVLTIDGCVLLCYPKYLIHNDEPLEELKQVIKVIEKYNGKEQIIKMYNETADSTAFNMLAVMLWLIQDYFENGSYDNSQDVVEVNGEGDILWEKTINETFAIISNNRPYYPEMFTRRRISDETDFFKRLHEAVLTICSKELMEAHLLDLFELTEVDLSDEEIDDFGDTEYILSRLSKELNVQFNTRKQLLLKTLYAYISNSSSHIDDMDCFSLFGTNSFNLVWEKACAQILDDKLHIPLGSLGLPGDYSVKHKDTDMLIEVIDRPVWFGNIGDKYYPNVAKDTLIPDIVSLYKEKDELRCVIFDAKYYNLTLGKNKLHGQPGIESIGKQYLYQMAYREFLKEQNITHFRNCFLMPTEKDEIIESGVVMMGFLRSFGLEDIRIRLLPARMVFDLYLEGKKLEISKLNLDHEGEMLESRIKEYMNAKK